MSSRHVKSVPRGTKSGLPFNARFIDIAENSGLRNISICGHPKRVDYVIEAMGCGAAFLDYDNDGWLDVLVLSGSRFGDPPPDASNRLYRNNRDGTFSDVTAQAGLFRPGYFYGVTVGDYNNDGHEDLSKDSSSVVAPPLSPALFPTPMKWVLPLTTAGGTARKNTRL